MQTVTIPSSTVNFLERTLASLEEKASRGDVPPKSARQAAERGLELREKFGRGGTMIGVARARDIKNGRTLSEQTVRRMKAYFDRHEVDKQGKDWDNEERPSNGKIAWLLWGGDSGRSWATSKVESWNREDGKTKTLPRWLPNGEEITELKHLAAVLCIDEKTAAHCVLDSRNPSQVLLREAKAIVRTAVGSIHYGQPIGATIVADGISWRSRVMESVRTPWDGFTLSFMRGTEPVDGYIVAKQYRNREMKVSDFYDGDKGIDNLFDWIRANEPEFHEGEQYLGLWHDAKNDEIVFDVSMRFTNREQAIAIGVANNQQSIYDVVAKDTIDTGGTGDRKALNDGKILGETTYPYVGDDGRRTEELAERSNGSVQVKGDEGAVSRNTAEADDPSIEDGDWSSRTGTRHYSNGRVLRDTPEEKRQVRDASFWGAPVGTPLPLPDRYRRSSPRTRELIGIGTHGVVRAARARNAYIKKNGLEEKNVDYRKVTADKERAVRIADAYDELPVDDPNAYDAYDALSSEIDAQYEYLTNELGVEIEFVADDPYSSSYEMMDDVENNNRLKVLKTDSTFPHPYLTNEQNDKFRAVHDYFGHAATGRGFAQDGEEAAWVSHSTMFSREARSALTTETRGQNSWYNVRKEGFAVQKVALLPEEFWDLDDSLEMKSAGVDWSVPQLTSFTQRKGVRRVRDSKFWGKPVGTIITRGMIDDRARGPRVPNSPSSPRVSPRDKFEPLAGGRDRTYLTVDASSIDNLGDTEKQEQKDALLSVFDRTLDQLVSNLSSLFERSEASGAREVGSVWYEDGGNMAGTHAIANDMTREQGCGVFAAMSPLREWEDNVAIGKYIMDIVAEDPVIPDLTVRATKSVKDEDGKMRKVTMTAYEWTALEMSNRGMGSPDDIIGLKFSELPIETQALMVRMLSQAGYFTDHPEEHQGEKLGFMGTDKQGRPKWKSVGWSSGDVHTAKALNIARATPEEVDSVINAQLEGMKVRSFYNNLSLGENNEYPDITMDTHAMSAAAGRTYGSQSREKSVFFGGPPRSAPYGFKGLYPIFAEAFRIVAEENGIPPHRMQAILWLQWRHETENMPIITHTTMAG